MISTSVRRRGTICQKTYYTGLAWGGREQNETGKAVEGHREREPRGHVSYSDVCRKEYRSKENLRAHMRTIHHKMSFVASTIKKQ